MLDILLLAFIVVLLGGVTFLLAEWLARRVCNSHRSKHKRVTKGDIGRWYEP